MQNKQKSRGAKGFLYLIVAIATCQHVGDNAERAKAAYMYLGN